MKPGAFLDRDGVINASVIKEGLPFPPKSLSEVKILPGVKESIELLKSNGYVPIVVTNQPDIARGSTSPAKITEINDYISKSTGISHFYICPHDDTDDCSCRKPKPGLIWNAVEELKIDISKSFLVGDRWRDIEAGNIVGMDTYFVDYSYDEKQPNFPYKRVSSLQEVVNLRLGVERGPSTQ